jgi:hypothetical protein
MTYTVAIAAGTQVQLSLQDATGDEAWSGTVIPFPIFHRTCGSLFFCYRSLSRRVLMTLACPLTVLRHHQRQRRVLPYLDLRKHVHCWTIGFI